MKFFDRIRQKIANRWKKGPKFLYAGFLSHWGTVRFVEISVARQKDHFIANLRKVISRLYCTFSVLTNGFHYASIPLISDDNVFQGVKSKVVKYLGIDADSSDIDLNGLCCLAAGWYFSHLYGILPPGATLAVKMSFAARKGFSLITVINYV